MSGIRSSSFSNRTAESRNLHFLCKRVLADSLLCRARSSWAVAEALTRYLGARDYLIGRVTLSCITGAAGNERGGGGGFRKTGAGTEEEAGSDECEVGAGPKSTSRWSNSSRESPKIIEVVEPLARVPVKASNPPRYRGQVRADGLGHRIMDSWCRARPRNWKKSPKRNKKGTTEPKGNTKGKR